MKRFFILSATIMLLSSCTTLTPFYQLCNVKSELPVNDDGEYQYSDNSCLISYNFWKEFGNGGFTFENKTNEIIYIDLSKSFFIRNGSSMPYFLNRTEIESIDALTFGKTTGLTAGKNIEYKESDVIAIAPHSHVVISEYDIATGYIHNCDYNLKPKKTETPEYEYDKVISPIQFSNYITYKIGNGEEKVIQNDFYVNSLKILDSDRAVVETNIGCKGEKKNVKVVQGAIPVRFYIKYEQETKVDHSRGDDTTTEDRNHLGF